jgi:hypothetical protein
MRDATRSGGRWRAAFAALLVTIAALSMAEAASAQQSQVLGPWDGTNPFNCQLQNVGTGTDFPDPGADPFCVEFDKTEQSLLPNAGLIDFLANEPARVAAAAPKCFYFQRDHWTGSVVQGQPPELWHWDGNYFFDKAKGIGGVNVDNFRTGGQPASAYDFAPPQYKPFFTANGGGGVMMLLESGPDPACVEKAAQGGIYAGQPQFGNCVTPGGELYRRQVGHVGLGMRRETVLGLLGPPHSQRHGTDRWCVIGDGELRIAYRSGSPEQVAAILTTVLGHTAKGVRTGSKRRRAIRRLDLERRFRAAGAAVFEAPRKPRRRLFVAIGGKRVKWLAITDPGTLRSLRAAKRALRQAAG